MPDTKRGREREGQKKREQLEAQLTKRELEALEEDGELPEYPPTDADGEFIASGDEVESQ